jgi:hypothetical protein
MTKMRHLLDKLNLTSWADQRSQSTSQAAPHHTNQSGAAVTNLLFIDARDDIL